MGGRLSAFFLSVSLFPFTSFSIRNTPGWSSPILLPSLGHTDPASSLLSTAIGFEVFPPKSGMTLLSHPQFLRILDVLIQNTWIALGSSIFPENWVDQEGTGAFQPSLRAPAPEPRRSLGNHGPRASLAQLALEVPL